MKALARLVGPVPGHDHPIELQDLLLEAEQLSAERGKTRAGNLWHPFVARVGNNMQQFHDTFTPDRLLRRLCWHEPHVGSGDRLANSLSVSHVVLLPFDIGFYIGWRHQPHGMAEYLELARPVVRRGAGLYANQAWRQLLKERENVATL